MTKKPVLLVTHVTAGDPGQIPILLEAMDRPVRIMRANKGEPIGPNGLKQFSGRARRCRRASFFLCYFVVFRLRRACGLDQ